LESRKAASAVKNIPIKSMATLSDFDDIRPYSNEELRPALDELLSDRQFRRLLKGFVPWLPQSLLRSLIRISLVGLKTTLGFQKRFMKPAIAYLLKKCSKGCVFENPECNSYDRRYTFLSNHRDIVLDSAILDYKLVMDGAPTVCEIGIGDNLLIYPWIRSLVRLNRAFTVRRALSSREILRSSQHMSEYIHFAINDKRENVWLAQREGRAKDSDDRTQESVLKMLALGGEGSPVERLKDLNIVPLTISYEFDPCDYLKAKEFQMKRDDPAFKKSRQDDLENMKVGIRGYKGRIHYKCSPCINGWLDELTGLTGNEFYQEVARRMDKEIHSNYEMYPNNYIALDELNGDNGNSANYTDADKAQFDAYLAGQIAKIDLPNKDEAFLRDKILNMYANPLRNYMRATETN
jgi:hypothetical protein